MDPPFPSPTTTSKVNRWFTLLIHVEFVDLYVELLLNKSISSAFTQFQEGFNLVCKDTAISIFHAKELEILVCGSSVLDFDALHLITSYDGGFSEETPVIQFVPIFISAIPLLLSLTNISILLAFTSCMMWRFAFVKHRSM